MKTIYLTLLALAITGLCEGQSISQFVIANAGSALSGPSGSLSFTMGEPVVGDISNGESLGQGFWYGANQIILSTNDFTEEMSTVVYPNPVSDILNIVFSDITGTDFHLAMYDINGRMLLRQEINQNSGTESINLSRFTPGVYLLTLEQAGTQKSKTFKLIKQ